MQNAVLHIVKELEGGEQLEAVLSFHGFIEFLKTRLKEERTMRAKFLDFVIHHFEERLQGKDIIREDEIGEYGDLMELMFTCVFPPLTDERESVWALGVPVTPTVFYGTDPFYDKLRDPVTWEIKACMVDKGQMERKKINLELVYSLILQRLYHFPFVSGNTVIRSMMDKDTGLAHFYRLNLDVRFIEVLPKGQLPPFDPTFLQSKPPVKEAVAWLQEHIPLNAFLFKGISALTVTDINTEYVVESIKELILNSTHADMSHHQEKVIRYLNVLAGTNDVKFALLPLLKVNGKPVYSDDICDSSLLSQVIESQMEAGEKYLCMVDKIFREPRLILYERVPELRVGERVAQADGPASHMAQTDRPASHMAERVSQHGKRVTQRGGSLPQPGGRYLQRADTASQPDEPASSQQEELFFLEALRKAGIHSYGLVPVYYNNKLAGVLEVSSQKADCLSKDLLSRLEVVIPLLAQLLQHTIEEFETRIKGIIKENFTSIQPAVEWKFNEVAWHYDRMQRQGKDPMLETIYFKEVYPLYGAIDIRNSTMERNGALRRDLETQFRLLIQALTDLQEGASLQLVDEMMHQAQKWQLALTGALTTADELNLNTFLKEKVSTFLTHFSQSRPDLAVLMDPYLAAIEEATGEAFRHRRELESCIQLINRTINEALELTVPELQESYPSYFEKFRTDGVEYDLYIGGSIAPERPFDLLYLRNLRLWQLSSMAAIAGKTHALLPEMVSPLLTTQLIFVHSSPIDISFRKDERRFDVEGGYNIRYQVVKKRIDKVRVRDTGERLTQPGMIAIIYFNDREEEEYEGYIRYLQEKGILGREVEHLELEEVQGVSGLRALRVRVNW